MEQGACLQAWWHQHIFFRTNSALLWRNPGWQTLQREGYAGDCVAGGGRFWFVFLHSNILSTDLGLCAPPECSSDEVSWVIFPEQHKDFFHSSANIQFAVQVREYHDLGGAVYQASVWVAFGLVLSFIFAIIGLAAMALASPHSGGAFKLNGLSYPWRLRLTSWSPLQVMATCGLVIREVTLHTRWSKYHWHESRSPIFKLARNLGKLDEVLPVLKILELTCQVGELCTPDAQSKRSGRLKSVAVLIILHTTKLVLVSLFWIAVAQASEPVLSTNIFSNDAWLRPGWSNALTFCANAGMQDILLAFSPEHIFRRSTEVMCPHLEPFYSEFYLLTLATPLLLITSVTGSELTGIVILGAAWYGISQRGLWSRALPHPKEAMSFLFGILLVTQSTRLPTKRCLLLNFLVATVLGTAAMAFPSFAAVGSAVLLPVCLMGVRLVFKEVMLHSGLSFSWFGAAGAVPAIPLVLFAVEGYAEPHAKWLTPYDFFLRAVALAASCWALGAFTEAAWHGLAWCLSDVPLLLSSAVGASCSGIWDALCQIMRSAVRLLQGSVRLSFQDLDGKEYCACQAYTAALLVALLAMTPCLAWATLTLLQCRP